MSVALKVQHEGSLGYGTILCFNLISLLWKFYCTILSAVLQDVTVGGNW